VVLALCGGACGLFLASLGTKILVKMIAESSSLRLPFWVNIRTDFTVLAFVFAVSLAVGLLFGLAPALPALRVNLHDTLREAPRAGTSGKRGHVRHLLAVSEIALALLLLIGAGLLAKSLLRLWSVDPGFRSAPRLTFSLRLPFFNQATP